MENIKENGKIAEEKELQDPMAFDTEEGLAKKERTWDDIFLRCPDFADYIIEMYNAGGEKAIKKLHDYLGTFQDLKTEE